MTRRKILATVVAVTALLAVSLVAAWPRLLDRAPDAMVRRAARVFRRDPRPHVVLGERLLTRGEILQSLEELTKAASLGSVDVRLGVAMVDALRRLGLHEEAAGQARELLQLEPRFGRLHRVFGQCRIEQGRISEGLASLERATLLAPQDADGWIALAEARIGIEGFRTQTAQVWEQGHTKNPDHDLLRFGLAEAYVNLGRYAEADALLRDLAERPVPSDEKGRDLYARAWSARGAVLRRLQPDATRLRQARQALERALTLAPRHPETHYELGLLHADEGRWEDARRSLEHATDLRSYAHPFWHHLARVYRRLGEARLAERAEARFELLVSTFAEVNRESQYVDAHPHDVDRRLDLARLHMKRHDWDAARLHLFRVLRDHPRHPVASRLMRRLGDPRV